MAATKRKSNEAINLPTKKPNKIKKKSETVSGTQGKKSSKGKSKKDDDEKKDKALSITFPEEGKIEWNSIKKQSKLLTKERKLKKDRNGYDSIQEAKQKFEIFRSSKCKGEEREKLIMDCTKQMKGLLTAKARSHDVARLIQWLLKLGSKEVKHIVVGEIINDVVALAQCKYSSHIVRSIMKTCDSGVRRKIIAKLSGNTVKLLSSKFAAPIMEDIYLKYSTSSEKLTIRRDLYGDICKPFISINQELKFKDILEQNKALAPSILTSMKNTLSKCMQKPWLLKCPVVMIVLYDYLDACDEKDRSEMLESLRSNVTMIIKTKEGADVGLVILRYSSAKEKKDIIKDIKGDIANIAVSPSGCLFLLHLIDSVDDTVLMKKALLPTVIDSADDLIANESGRKIISYIVAHRDGHFFHPSYVNKLKKADDSAFVKKNSETRMKELQDACIPPLLEKIHDNPKLWLKDGGTGLMTASVLLLGSGDKLTEAFKGIADFIKNPESTIRRLPSPKDPSQTGVDTPAVEDAGLNKSLKKIIKDDAVRVEKNTTTFTEILVSRLDSEVIERWSTSNRGCFVLVFLVESGIESVVSALKEKMKSCHLRKKLKNSEFKGAEILLTLLD